MLLNGISLAAVASSGAISRYFTITFDDGTFTGKAGGQWYLDGVAVEGATGASWTPGDMADVYGRAISQMINGVRSNVIVLAQPDMVSTLIDFNDAADNTQLRYYPASTPFTVLVDAGAETDIPRQIVEGGRARVVRVMSGFTGPMSVQETGSANHFAEFEHSSGSRANMVVCVSDNKNCLIISNTSHIVTLTSRIAGAETSLGTFRVNGATYALVGVYISNRKYQVRIAGTAYAKSVSAQPSVAQNIWYDLPAGLADGTKVGIAASDGIARYADNFRFGPYEFIPIILGISGQDRSPVDPNKTRVTLTGTYSGISGIEYLVLRQNGALVLPWTPGQEISGGTLNQYVDIPLTSGEAYELWARDPADPTSAISLSATAPVLASGGDAILGMNESEVTQWNSPDPWTDLAYRSQWRTPSYGYIGFTADGENGSAKGDLDGTVYGYNTLGLTEYLLATPFFYSETGDYIIDLAPGLTVGAAVANSTWNYNSSTGQLTYTVTSTASTTNTFTIATASIPPEGFKPRIRKAGTDPVGFQLRDLPKASLPQISSILRNMSSSGINAHNNTKGGRTDTALPVDTPSNVAPGAGASNNARKLLAYEAAGQALWINTFHTASDDLISADAAYLASASQRPYSELCNELWNQAFAINNQETYLAGYRRGYGAAGVNTHADAVPETIIDARPYVNRYSLLVSGRSFEVGDLLFVDQNGVGWVVYEAIAAISPGDTITTGTNVTLRYNQTAANRAQLKWLGRRSKEMWALQDEAFATAGKPRPIHVLAWGAALGFNAVQPALDFDEVYKQVDRVATAPYFGNSFGTYANAAWSQTSKDKWYAGEVQDFIEEACAAMIPVIDAKVAETAAYSNNLAAYSLEKRGDKDAIRLAFYECGQHIQFAGWPDMAGAWSAGTDYKVGNFAYSNPAGGGDGKTYRCKVKHTNQPLNDTDYWEVFVDGNGDPWDATKTATHRGSAPRGYQAAWNALSRSPEFADVLAYYFQQMEEKTGVKEIMFFDRVKVQETRGNTGVNAASAINGWGMMVDELDTDISGDAGTNWQFKMLKEFKESLEP